MDLPSWCPDFNSPVSGAMFGLLNQYYAGYKKDAEDNPDLRHFSLTVSSASDDLQVPGLPVDKVRAVILPDWKATMKTIPRAARMLRE